MMIHWLDFVLSIIGIHQSNVMSMQFERSSFVFKCEVNTFDDDLLTEKNKDLIFFFVFFL